MISKYSTIKQRQALTIGYQTATGNPRQILEMTYSDKTFLNRVTNKAYGVLSNYLQLVASGAYTPLKAPDSKELTFRVHKSNAVTFHILEIDNDKLDSDEMEQFIENLNNYAKQLTKELD